tara:strand:+ start:1333 stop:2361 length:1029 start_codon:yes stop_codon:yes gene_type:complete
MDELNTLIFRTDRIGDFIISSPFILSYKKKFKNNQIILISSEYNYNYIKNFKFVNKIFPLKNEIKFFRKLIGLIKMIIQLRKVKYSNIIILDGKNRSFFISLFLKGKKSILLQSRNLEFLSKIFNYKRVFNYEIQNQHKNFSFLASNLNFNINLKKIDIYKDYSFNNENYIEKKYITIHLDEKWFTKYYYNDFTDINPTADQLDIFVKKIMDVLNYEYNIVITTGSKKLDLLKEYTKEFDIINKNKLQKKVNQNKIIFISNSTFNDLETIIKNSSFLICCEGGVSHVSHNMNIKTIAFFEKNRLQHTHFWTSHMNNLTLFERKGMNKIINDNNFFTIISNKI